MSVIEEKANAVCGNMVKNGEDKVVMFNPLFIIAVISVLIEIVKLWKDCNKKPLEAVADARSPGILTRWAVRRAVRKHLDDEEMEPRYAAKLSKAVLTVGAEMNEEEMAKAFAEV